MPKHELAANSTVSKSLKKSNFAIGKNLRRLENTWIPNPDRLVLRNDASERVVIATLISGKIFYGLDVLFPNFNSCRNQIPD